MATNQHMEFISEAEYLAGEEVAEFKNEYINGRVHAMPDVTRNHNLITGNVGAAFHQHLKGLPWWAFMSRMKVRTTGNYFYPDVQVAQDELSGDDVYTEAPVILVEVLSKSTRRMDETTKQVAYLQIPTLQEYVLIEQDFVNVEVLRRDNGWQSEHYYLGDEVTFTSIGLTLAVETIYEYVQNADMAEWLQKKAGEAGA